MPFRPLGLIGKKSLIDSAIVAIRGFHVTLIETISDTRCNETIARDRSANAT